MRNSISIKLLTAISKITLCLLLTLPVRAQRNYFVKHYTNDNGLPANGIKGIELDKKTGFLWIGTQGGMVRFDGSHFTRFAASKDALTSSRVALIGRNREGAIFFSDENFSVNRVNGNQPVFAFKDTFFTPPPFRPNGSEYYWWPAAKIAAKVRNLTSSSFLPPWVVFRDQPGDSTSFSFLHFEQVYHYQANSQSLLPYPGVNMIVKVNNETYFVRSPLDLSWYNDSLAHPVPAVIHGLPLEKTGEEPRIIWKRGMDAPLIITGRNIWKLAGKNDSLYVQPVCRECCPENANITCAQDWQEQGVLFLGSETNGLYVIKTPVIRAVRAEPDVEAGRAEYGQMEFVPGTITTAAGLTFTSEGKVIGSTPALQFPLSNMFRDRQGDYWYSIDDTIVHLYRYDGHRAKIPVRNKAIKMVFAEMDGRIYVVSELEIAEITGDRYRPLFTPPVRSHDLNSIFNPDAATEWQPGIIAIAAGKLMLFNVARPTKLDTILIPGLTARIRTVLKYGDYRLIGSYGQGFYIYKNGIVRKMPLDINGYLSHAHCFMPDANGYCWISTNHGLFKVSLQALFTAYEKGLNEIYYQYFGNEDGIINTEFNGGCQPCALQLSNGLFSFPTMNGIALLDPLQPHSPPPTGNISIDGVWVDSAARQVNDGYLQPLPYAARTLRLKLAIPYFSNTENIYFSYKLEPYSNEWETQDIIKNDVIQFGGLKPGNYTLYLRLRNGFGPDDFGTTTVRFRVLKPWYQTWWFYLLCALGLMALLSGLVKWRTARIAKRKEELQELVTVQTQSIAQQSTLLESQLSQLQSQQLRLEEDNNVKARLIGIISHDMISPLKFMGYMSKRLKEGFAESDPSYHTAGFIANVAQELESLSMNILNWIKFHHQSVKMKPERFDLRQLITESVEIPATLAKEKGLLFEIEIPAHTEIIQYRQAIGVIIYNLSVNAVKYTASGSIKIQSQNLSDGWILSVTDTGAGMPAELVRKLNSIESFVASYSVGETSKYQFGYIIIKDLLRLLDGSMKVDSFENKGTTVTIQFGKMPDLNNAARE